jgi:predicted RNase H-like HicB family nuclease
MKIIIILEKGDNEIWARAELPGYLITTVGNTIKEVSDNIFNLIKEHKETDPDQDIYFKKLDMNNIVFDYKYDLTELGQKIDAVKIKSLAIIAEINPTLLQQYVNGFKFPSKEQVDKIENAVYQLGKKLMETKLVAC